MRHPWLQDVRDESVVLSDVVKSASRAIAALIARFCTGPSSALRGGAEQLNSSVGTSTRSPLHRTKVLNGAFSGDRHPVPAM